MMSSSLFLVLLATAVVATPLVVLLIPRARRSPAFDRLLWAATVFVAFLGGWMGVGMATSLGMGDLLVVAGTPVLGAFVGALVGGLAVNLPLWLLDQFERPEMEDEEVEWEEGEEEDGLLEEANGNGARHPEETSNPDQDVKREA